MVERVNSFSIAQMQSNLGAAVSLDSTGHSVKNVIIYTRYLITFAFCYACVSIYLFTYTFIIKTYYMYNMFRFNGRFYGRSNIMRQGVNICLHFCLLDFCFFTCKKLSFIFPLYLQFQSHLPSHQAHSAFTLRSPAFVTPLSLHSPLTKRSLCVQNAFTLRSPFIHLSFIQIISYLGR